MTETEAPPDVKGLWIGLLRESRVRHDVTGDELLATVAGARRAGLSWSEVGEGLDVVRQTAHRFWRPRLVARYGSESG